MMKKKLGLKIGMIAVACVLFIQTTKVTAFAADDKVNLLATKADWSLYLDNNSILTFEDGVMSITPTDTNAGGLYVADTYKSAVIEFEYQISYDEGVEPYSEEDGAMLPSSFWGIMFGYNVTIDDNWSAKNIMPWYTTETYPYMLCFDTERQTADTSSERYTQLGLSIRRYNALGGHDYAARWSTVDPGNFDYVASNGRTGTSVIPEFYKPINVSDCYDTDRHKVKMEYHAEYTENGAEKDAIVINVWFDEELALTVVDDMPFKGESWGTEVDVDKREQAGYIGVFAHHGSVSDAELFDWKVDLYSLTVQSTEESDKGDIPTENQKDTDNDGENNKIGVEKVVVISVIVVALLLTGVVVLITRRKKSHEE